jgi:hypothetical protein
MSGTGIVSRVSLLKRSIVRGVHQEEWQKETSDGREAKGRKKPTEK